METSLTAPFRGRVRAGARRRQRPRRRAGAARAARRRSTAGRPRASARAPVVRARDGARAGGGAGTLPREPRAAASGSCSATTWAPPEVARIVADLHGACADLLACDPALVPGEHRLLGMFADLHALSRPRHDELDPEQRAPAQPAGAPARVAALARRRGRGPAGGLRGAAASGRWRTTASQSLDRTPALEDACYRLFLSQQRADTARAAIVAILDRRLEQADELAGHVGDDFRDALDRLVRATEGRDPVLADLAREVRFRYFDEPVDRGRARARLRRDGGRTSAALAADPDARGPRRARRRARRLPAAAGAGAHARACATPSPALRRALLESLMRRYYRMRSLEGFDELELDGHAFLARRATGSRAARATSPPPYVRPARTSRAPRARSRACAAPLPAGDVVVLDLYAQHDGRGARRATSWPRRWHAAPARTSSCRPPCTASSSPSPSRRRGRGMSAIDLFTFRPGPDGLVEDELAARPAPDDGAPAASSGACRTSRSSGCPSAEDVYLFHGVGRDNPKDERLFALAEVRDLTPVRDDDGRVAALPELERMLVEALEAIRRFQARRRAEPRACSGTACSCYVWPTIELTPEEIQRLRQPAGVRPPPASGIEMLLVARPPARARRRRARRACCASSRRRPGRASSSRSTTRRPRRCSPLDEGARRIVSARRRGAAAPGRDRQACSRRRAARPSARPASSSSTTSTTTGASCPSTARRPRTPPASSSGTIRNVTERHPGGHAARHRPRRPHARARLARRARVPADHRRARPRRAAGRPARVVRAVGRRQDRDGQRHREHGLDRRGAAPDRRSSPRPAARSTSSWPASTSAPSRTGTPRRRC